MNRICGIYKFENNINGHIYIGQSIDIKKRFREHKSASFNPNNPDYNLPIHSAIRKYGLENFSFDIIDICSEEKLNDQEIYWIDYYNSYTNGNYNISKGGNNREHVGKPVQCYDMDGNFIKEYPNAAYAARDIDISYSVMQQVLHEIRRSCGGYQWKYKDDPRKIEKYTNRQGGKIPVSQYSKEGVYMRDWESATQAGRELKIDSSSITKCLKGKLKTCGGFIWRYKEELK